MIGHFVTGTVWRVTVSWQHTNDEGSTVVERSIITASDDGSDVYEVARRSCFTDPAHATNFTLLKVRKVAQVEGFALGLGESERSAA